MPVKTKDTSILIFLSRAEIAEKHHAPIKPIVTNFQTAFQLRKKTKLKRSLEKRSPAINQCQKYQFFYSYYDVF